MIDYTYGYGQGRTTKKTTTTYEYDANGKLVKTVVVIEETTTPSYPVTYSGATWVFPNTLLSNVDDNGIQ